MRFEFPSALEGPTAVGGVMPGWIRALLLAPISAVLLLRIV